MKVPQTKNHWLTIRWTPTLYYIAVENHENLISLLLDFNTHGCGRHYDQFSQPLYRSVVSQFVIVVVCCSVNKF